MRSSSDASGSTSSRSGSRSPSTSSCPASCPATRSRGCSRRSRVRCAPSRSSRCSELFGAGATARCGSSTCATRHSLHRQPGHLDLPVPDPGLGGHRQPDRLDPAAGRHRPDHRRDPRQRARASSRPGGAAESSTRCSRPLLIFIGSFPYFWLAMGALYLFGVTLGWFPLRHAFGVGTDAVALPAPSSATSPPPRAAGHDDRAGLDRRLDAGHAQHDDRHHRRGLHHDGRGQGPAPGADHVPLRRPQRAAAPVTALRHVARLRRRRRTADRGRLRLPGHRLPAARARSRPWTTR